ncbi:tyrosine-type recombinase/integrase [Brevibacillus centrosporus]|uniref:site-specific integrase n=1 Tax=Brevibacillus centrosporus TaxID=54910 RepID=UPI003D1B4BD6
MMPGILPLENGKYRVTFDYGKKPDGGRDRRYKNVDTLEEAEKLLIEFKYNKQRNLLVQSNKMTLAEFLEHWLDNCVENKKEETTIYGYKNIIFNHVIPFLGDVELQKLQPAHIEQYYNKHLIKEKGLSPNTVIKHHAIIKKALKYALKHQLVHRNVADLVELPSKKEFEGKYYTQEQLLTLLNLVLGTKIEVPVYLASYLGLRRQEICGLKWENVDFTNRIIHIKKVRVSAGKETVTKNPKTKKSKRVLYIEDELFEVLQKCKARYDKNRKLLGSEFENSGYVFTKSNGKTYKVNYITDLFKEFLQKNDLPQIRLHDLRHTFASILYDVGVDLKSISEALGHSNVGTTDKIYTHRFDKTHKKTVSAISSSLKKAKDSAS